MTAPSYAHLWPRITDAQRERLVKRLTTIADESTDLANRVTVYPGGGAHAYRLRLAAEAAREALVFIRDDVAAKPQDPTRAAAQDDPRGEADR